MIRKIILLLSAGLGMMACGLEETKVGDHSNPDGIWTGPPQNMYGQVCHVTVVDYPVGYDWRSDPGGTEAACSLSVFADGVPVLKVPVGDSHHVSADPERHRVIGGHLYTDWTDGKMTVVKKDGRELFRYEASEAVVKMLVFDDEVHTLNIPSGGGFTYRVDGVLVIERPDAMVYDHLDLCSGQVCFCFSRTVRDASGMAERYYSVVDGTVAMVDMSGSVHDMRMHDGEVCALVSAKEDMMPFLVRGMSEEKLRILMNADTKSAEFVDSDILAASLRCVLYPDLTPVSVLWYGELQWRRSSRGRTAVALCASPEGICMVCNPSAVDSGIIYAGTDEFEMPSGYSVRGLNPVAFGEDGAVVGLSSDTGGPPAVWTDGDVKVLNANGYIARVSLSDDVSC